MTIRNVLVVGACGYTAQLIVDQLKQEDCDVQISGRNAQKLEHLKVQAELSAPVRIFDVENSAQYDKILSETDIIINCAGPYEFFSGDFIRAVSSWPGVYIDLTGELNVVLRSFTELDERCKNHQCVIIHSCAFESMLADLLLDEIIDNEAAYDDLSSYYQHWNTCLSPGTRLTAKLTNPATSVIYRDGRFRPTTSSDYLRSPQRSLASGDLLAYYSPLPEVAFFPYRCNTRNAGSYVLLPDSEARFLAGLRSRHAVDSDAIIAKHKSRDIRGPNDAQRRRHRFRVTVTASQCNAAPLTVMAEGVDPYGITALFVAQTLRHIASRRSESYGVISPARFVAGRDMLETLAKQADITVTKVDSL